MFPTELQMTDVELDARVTDLEENGGNSDINGKSQCPSSYENAFKRVHYFNSDLYFHTLKVTHSISRAYKSD